MFATVKSELIRLRRPSFLYGGIGLMGAFALLMSTFSFATVDEAASSVGPGSALPSLFELEAAGGFLASLGLISTIVGLITLAFWALATAGDYSSGLIRVLVQAQPNRVRLLFGKVAALAMWTTIGTFVATAVATAASFVFAGPFDIDTALWSDGFVTEFLSGWLNLTLSALVWGVVGLVIAAVTRSSGLAIAGGIGYLMVVENMIGLVAENAVDWMPGGVLSAVAGGGTATVAYGTALLLAGVYAVAGLIGAALTVRSRDIVS